MELVHLIQQVGDNAQTLLCPLRARAGRQCRDSRLLCDNKMIKQRLYGGKVYMWFLILLLTLCQIVQGQGIRDPTQRLGPNSSVTPRVFFQSSCGSVTNNLPGDICVTPTNIYLCQATAGTPAPACTGIGALNWGSFGIVSTNVPDLTISMSHTGSFTQGDTGKTYSIIVTNSGTAITSGSVVVNLVPPTGTGGVSLG